ncbi:hypothetical protein HAX54_016241 [Datura stramonium]|uniref:Uncharacterized protein n=1 Tax=Datura stramonium TaxID=4076 RepID=A0ABS8UKT5_DATST|nr:hypothetical protein [Datura stramonium]
MENGKKAQHQPDERKVEKENLQNENNVKVPSKNIEDFQNQEEGVHAYEIKEETQQPNVPDKNENNDMCEEGIRDMHTPNSYGKQPDTASQGSVTVHRPTGSNDGEAKTMIVL